MKTIIKTSMILLIACYAFGCENDNEPATETVEVTFDFYSLGKPAGVDGGCGEPPIVYIQQDGEGTADVFGNITFYARFCSNFETGEYFMGPSGFGYFIDADKDTLELSVEGSGFIVPSDNPDYISEFHNDFQIAGGTGKFEGATGSGISNGYNIAGANPPRTEQEWTGTITLVK